MVLAVAVPLAVTAVIWAGLHTDPADPATAATPEALLTGERGNVERTGLLFAVLGAVATGALYAAYGPAELNVPALAIAAGTVGAFAGLLGRLDTLATWSFTVTRHYLTTRYGLPRDLMAFLDDAHRHRGVLRQSAGVYELRHLDLQRALASPAPHHRATPLEP